MEFLKDPETGKPSELVTLTVLVTVAAVIRFLFDGVTFEILGQSITLGHVDSSTYLAFLAPVLGLHGYIKRKPHDNKN